MCAKKVEEDSILHYSVVQIRGKHVLLALSLIALFLASITPIATIVSAVDSSQDSVGILDYTLDVERGYLSVWNAFYNITINLNVGARIEGFQVRHHGIQYELVQCGETMPSLILYARTNTTTIEWPPTHTVSYGNDTYTVRYPGNLAFEKWTARVKSRTQDTLIVELLPGREALSDIAPLNLSVFVYFSAYAPFIEYHVRLYNPSDEPVLLYSYTPEGNPLGLEVRLVACDGSPHLWNQTILLVNETGSYLVSRSMSGSLMTDLIKEPVYAAAVTRYQGETKIEGRPLYIAALLPIEPRPEAVFGAKGMTLTAENGNITSFKDPVMVSLIYPAETIRPGSSLTLVFRVAYIPASINIASLAGLSDLLYAIDKQGYLKELDTLLNYNDIISNLQEELNNTKADLEKLASEKEDLQKQIGELKASLGLCEASKSRVAENLKILRNSLEKATLKQFAALGAGLVLGLIGGFIIRQVLVGEKIRSRKR